MKGLRNKLNECEKAFEDIEDELCEMKINKESFHHFHAYFGSLSKDEQKNPIDIEQFFATNIEHEKQCAVDESGKFRPMDTHKRILKIALSMQEVHEESRHRNPTSTVIHPNDEPSGLPGSSMQLDVNDNVDNSQVTSGNDTLGDALSSEVHAGLTLPSLCTDSNTLGGKSKKRKTANDDVHMPKRDKSEEDIHLQDNNTATVGEDIMIQVQIHQHKNEHFLGNDVSQVQQIYVDG